MDEATKLLMELDRYINTAHLDMGGKHRYTLNAKAYPVINEIKRYLSEYRENVLCNEDREYFPTSQRIELGEDQGV